MRIALASAVSSWVLVAVSLSATGTQRVPIVLRPATQAIALLFISAPVLFPSDSTAFAQNERIGSSVVQAALAVLLFGALGIAAGHELRLLLSVTALSVLALAAVEELVFRWLLPRRLVQVLSETWTPTIAIPVSVVAAQILFAACHYVPGGSRAFSPDSHEIARLIGAGLLYSLIVSKSRLWIAIGLHAALNISVIYGLSQRPTNTLAVVALGLIALTVLAQPRMIRGLIC